MPELGAREAGIGYAGPVACTTGRGEGRMEKETSTWCLTMDAGNHQTLPSEANSVAPAGGSLRFPVIIQNQVLAVQI